MKNICALLCLSLIIFAPTILPDFCSRAESASLTVSYGKLLNKGDIIRTGQQLGSALRDPGAKGALQPILDKYSYLLPYAIEMTHGPALTLHSSLAEQYPAGSPQPAWAAIIREGRIVVMPDYKNHVQVYLPGDAPGTAYRKNYSILRHILGTLLPGDNSSLIVAVYTYNHSYTSSEFVLNTQPYVFKANKFPISPHTTPLNLPQLEAFFNNGGELEYAEISKKTGLNLYAQNEEKMTLDGTQVSLSDLATAYRAVFHAGNNQAFISLDPHNNVTKTTVNFGGLLQDTRIGSVVLEADKRFKTISSGLDPDTFEDLRNYTRKYVPDFYSVSEREFLNYDQNGAGNWVKTRFWFYPDSIELVTDKRDQFVKIKKPQFLADAERSSDDFASTAEYRKNKKQYLLPSIRKNIDHLNNHYPEYASAYPEIKELATVARLMGICSWLLKTKPDWLDLDELLTVELPAVKTERERTQLITAAYLSENPGQRDPQIIKTKLKITLLSSILDQTVNDYFESQDNLAEYLCKADDVNTENAYRYKNKVNELLKNHKKVLDLILSRRNLQTFCLFSANKLNNATTLDSEKADLDSDKTMLAGLGKDINNQKEQIKNEKDTATRNDLAAAYNNLINNYNSLSVALNKKVDAYNNKIKHQGHRLFIEMSGGINLEPQFFKIKKATSTEQKYFTEIKKRNISNTQATAKTEKWKQNKSTPSGPKPAAPKQVPSGYLFYRDSQTNSWSNSYSKNSSSIHKSAYDAARKTMQITEEENGKVINTIQGKMVNNNKIEFSN